MFGIIKKVIYCTVALYCLFVIVACENKGGEQRDDLAEARAALGARDYIEAEKSFERYLRRYPDASERWEAWNDMVDLALNVRQDRRLALDMLEAMLVEFEDQSEKMRRVIIRLGEKYHESRRWADSSRVWVLMLDDDEASYEQKALAYRRMAAAYMHRMEFEPAREALGYCLKLDISPKSRSLCLYDLSDALITMENLDEAEATLRSLLQQPVVPDDTRALATFMLADVLEQRGKSTEAKVLFESILDSYPNREVVEFRLKNKNSKTIIMQPADDVRGPKGSRVGSPQQN